MKADEKEYDAFIKMVQAVQAEQEQSFRVTLDNVVEVQNDPCIQVLKDYVAQTRNTYVTYSHA